MKLIDQLKRVAQPKRMMHLTEQLINVVQMNRNTLFIESLLEEGALVDEVGESTGLTALHAATMMENQEALLLFLKHAKKLDAQDTEGRTPLHHAAAKGNQAIALLLLKSGASIDAKDSEGRHPIHYVAQVSHQTPVKMQEVFEILLERGAKVEAEDTEYRTPLHEAADADNEIMVQLCLARDAKLNGKDVYGRSALHRAVARNNHSMFELLLRQGANIEISDRERRTPLHFAAALGHQKLVERLLESGAMIDFTNFHGKTALHEAVVRDQTASVIPLLKKGAYSYPHEGPDQALERYWKAHPVWTDADQLLYTTLLLAGVPMQGQTLPRSLALRESHINATVAAWLAPFDILSDASCNLRPRVLRALPRLVIWLDPVNSLTLEKKLDKLQRLYLLPKSLAQSLLTESMKHPEEYCAFHTRLWENDWLAPHASPVLPETIQAATYTTQRLHP